MEIWTTGDLIVYWLISLILPLLFSALAAGIVIGILRSVQIIWNAIFDNPVSFKWYRIFACSTLIFFTAIVVFSFSYWGDQGMEYGENRFERIPIDNDHELIEEKKISYVYIQFGPDKKATGPIDAFMITDQHIFGSISEYDSIDGKKYYDSQHPYFSFDLKNNRFTILDSVGFASFSSLQNPIPVRSKNFSHHYSDYWTRWSWIPLIK